jgi:hypothetical protein
LTDVLFDVILPSVIGSCLWSFGYSFPIKYLNRSGIWHPLFVTKLTKSLSFNVINSIFMFYQLI